MQHCGARSFLREGAAEDLEILWSSWESSVLVKNDAYRAEIRKNSLVDQKPSGGSLLDFSESQIKAHRCPSVYMIIQHP